MNDFGISAGVAVGMWAAAPLIVTIVALQRVRAQGRAHAALARQWARRSRAARQEIDGLLLRPVSGCDPFLEQSLLSVLDARCSFRLRVRVGVAAADDPALPTAQRACASLRAAGLDAAARVVSPSGPNLKASTLAGLSPEHREAHGPKLVLCADGDVDLSGVDLDAVAGPLLVGDGPAQACWVPVAEAPAGRSGLGARASCAVQNGSLHAFGLLCGLDPKGLVGKLFAVRTDALVAVGGFAAVADYLGEDMALSSRLQKADYRVIPAAVRARAVSPRRSFRETVLRQGRWMAVLKAQRPHLLISYPLLFCSLGPMLAAAFWAGVLHGPRIGVVAAAVVLTARLVVAAAARSCTGQSWRLTDLPADAVLSEVVLWLALARTLSSRTVCWRGRALRIRGDGTVAPMGQ